MSNSVATLLWMALVFGLLVVPTVLLLWRRPTSRWSTLALIFYLANAAFAATYLVPWEFWGYTLFYVFAAIALAGIVAALVRMRRGTWQRPGWAAMTGTTVAVLLGGYFLMMNLKSVSARAVPANAIDLRSPLRDGSYVVIQGGSAPPLQMAHAAVPSQHYAVDIVKLNANKTSTSPYLQREDFAAHAVWEEPVYSPCTGQVVWSRDGIKDVRAPDEQFPAGNVVGIECQGVTVMLAHLREGSVTVAEGDAVETGQRLGLIGMSGRTYGPHLHIHAERGPLKRDFSDNTPVAFTLEGQFPYRRRVMVFGP